MPQIPVNVKGLSEQDIAASVAQYGDNNEKKRDFTIFRILWEQIFSLFNIIIIVLVLILVLIGAYNDGIFLGCISAINTVIGLIQELRARAAVKKLNKLAPKLSTVVRQNEQGESVLAQLEVKDMVIGDIVFLQNGDKVPLDGEVVVSEYAEFDESILTGESDYVQKKPGIEVFAGSFLVAGNCYFRVTKLAKDSYLQSISHEVQGYSKVVTPLQSKIDTLIKYLTYATLVFIAFVIGTGILQGITQTEIVKNAASVVSSLVPQGLVLITTISLAMGAVKMAKYQALVQKIHAVESMASVTVVCMDKTGTLTKNILEVRKIENLTKDSTIAEKLTLFVHKLSNKNKTLLAIEDYLKAEKFTDTIKVDELPFSSERKFSACVFEKEILVIGAPEVLIADEPKMLNEVKKYTEQSLRVLVFGVAKRQGKGEVTAEHVFKHFEPLCLIVIEDLIREEIIPTLQELAKEGIEFKIISGDSADTVAAIARRLHQDIEIKAITGSELEKLQDGDFVRAVLDHNIFARIRPRQKKEIIKALKSKGMYNAMIGDGANDVLAIKEANLGISMNDGSSMAKDVSDLVLLNNSFTTLPILLQEGKRIITNIQTIAYIYLIKNISGIIAFLILGILGLAFPFDPKHVTLTSFLVIGVPSFFLAFDNHKKHLQVKKFLPRLFKFSSIVGLMNSVIIIGIFAFYLLHTPFGLTYARTAILLTIILYGICNIYLIYRQRYTPREIFTNPWVLTIYGINIAGLVLIALVTPLREFFNLSVLRGLDVICLTSIVLITSIACYIALKKAKVQEKE